MKHHVLKIVNGSLYTFIGLWMLISTITTILRPDVKRADYWSSYVSAEYLLQNGLGMILFFGGLLLIIKGVFMILHGTVKEEKNAKDRQEEQDLTQTDNVIQ